MLSVLSKMISVKEALKIVEENAFIPKVSEVSLLESVGKVLAENITADRDFPPFNRVAMDGIAIAQTLDSFKIETIQYAGEAQKSLQNPENCMEVMTGAVLPSGCNTVIRYEDIEIQEVDGVKVAKISIPLSEISQGQNVHRQGSDRKMGDILLQKGLKISPSEIAVMASVGKASVKVEIPPKVAVISTGDELVEITANPLPYQIRMSNSYMLSAALDRVGVKANLFHLTDDKEELFIKLQEILANHDILLLSGGVSAGKKDFVPEILANLGVKKLFHKVAQKPGKPFWFGKTEEGKTVFALPGNPVSTFLCFCKYFLERRNEVVVLDKDVFFKPNLTYFVPVKTYFQDGKLMATPFEGSGSADFANLTDCDGFVELPAESQVFKKGEVFEFVRFRF
ncbi:molybdopterin molybdotransferase [Arcicella aurantiaca]|uniref:Molybdopterin molybdenumtransferase n=2 Tax=Arcicella aurantiaca TaxID=591202 RepID=A0A316DJJ2_9BACT|nr:molybdopterin molybdotransferase [Arcicella aurantiaca]